VAGALVTEIVFSYPGLGYQIYRAITNEDFFVIQGIFLFIIVGILIANFLVDLVYIIVDPRTRIGMTGGKA
jgi:ABC-type dipeptide/oligopeptide/nickel transport systems, permease components